MVWAKKQGLNTTRQHEALAWCWVEHTTEVIYQLWLAGAGVVEAQGREQELYRAISNLELIVRV